MSPRSHNVLLALLLICSGVPGVTPSAEATCPMNTLHCSTAFGPVLQTTSTSPTFILDCPDRYPTAWYSTVGYDLSAGQLSIRTRGGDSSSGNRMYLRDHYQLIGPPGWEPVTFEARLELTGFVASSAFLGVSLRSESSFDSLGFSATSSGPSFINLDGRSLVVTVTASVGGEFDLDIHHRSSAGWVRTAGTVHAEGQILFVGLPPGLSIQSCQGFVQEEPIPVERLSWSAVKARFPGTY